MDPEESAEAVPPVRRYTGLRSKIMRNDEISGAIDHWSATMAKTIVCLREWYILNKLIEFDKLLENSSQRSMGAYLKNAATQTERILLELRAINPLPEQPEER